MRPLLTVRCRPLARSGTLSCLLISAISCASYRTSDSDARRHLPAPPQEEGTLEKLRDEVKSSGHDRRHREDQTDEEEEASLATEVAGEILTDLFADESGGLADAALMVLLAPFTLPHMLAGDDFDRNAHFLSWPYARRGDGSRHGAIWIGNHDPEEPLQDWIVRISAEEGNDLDGVARTGVSFLLDTTARVGLQGTLNQLREDLADRNTDSLLLGDLNGVVRFAQSEAVQFRAGIGVNLLLDEDVHRAGINLLYGADVYPVRPLTFSFQVNGGRLGEANLLHLRATAGIQLSLFELFAGWDSIDIGSTKIDGPLVGLRVHF